MEKKKIDLISKIAIALMFFCILITLIFLYQQNKQECTSNPLPYSAKLYEDNFDIARATGTLTLWPNNKYEKPVVILFNSTGFHIQE